MKISAGTIVQYNDESYLVLSTQVIDDNNILKLKNVITGEILAAVDESKVIDPLSSNPVHKVEPENMKIDDTKQFFNLDEDLTISDLESADPNSTVVKNVKDMNSNSALSESTSPIEQVTFKPRRGQVDEEEVANIYGTPNDDTLESVSEVNEFGTDFNIQENIDSATQTLDSVGDEPEISPFHKSILENDIFADHENGDFRADNIVLEPHKAIDITWEAKDDDDLKRIDDSFEKTIPDPIEKTVNFDFKQEVEQSPLTAPVESDITLENESFDSIKGETATSATDIARFDIFEKAINKPNNKPHQPISTYDVLGSVDKFEASKTSLIRKYKRLTGWVITLLVFTIITPIVAIATKLLNNYFNAEGLPWNTMGDFKLINVNTDALYSRVDLAGNWLLMVVTPVIFTIFLIYLVCYVVVLSKIQYEKLAFFQFQLSRDADLIERIQDFNNEAGTYFLKIHGENKRMKQNIARLNNIHDISDRAIEEE